MSFAAWKDAERTGADWGGPEQGLSRCERGAWRLGRVQCADLRAVWAVIVVIFVKKHYFSGGIANGWTGEKGRIGQVDSGNVTLW